jgi:hypothetical protein
MRHLRKVFLFASAAVMAGSLVSIAIPDSAEAARGLNRGYFTNWNYSNPKPSPNSGNTCAMINGGIPTSARATKETLIAFIENTYRNSPSSGSKCKHNRMGAAYVIQTMRGATDYGMPSNSDIAEWKERLRSADVKMTTQTVSYSQNSGIAWRSTAGGRPLYDAVRYSNSGSQPALVFKVNGSVVYDLKIICANPLGNLPGLPDPVNYNLTPYVTSNDSTAVEGAQNVTLRPYLQNSGSTASPSGTQYQITDFMVPAGVVRSDIPGAGTGAAAPESYYGYNTLNTENGTTVFQTGRRDFNPRARSLQEYDPGTRICFALSVRPYSHTASASTWRHSDPFCFLVGKQPKVQVLGGDVFVGRAWPGSVAANSATIQTSVSEKLVGGAVTRFGSWVEYAASAPGAVTGLGSGSAYANQGITSLDACVISPLIFANTVNAQPCNSTTPVLGGYANQGAQPDVAGAFGLSTGATVLPASVDLGAYDGLYRAPADLTITGGTIGAGKEVIINAPDSIVTISGNITYENGPYDSPSQIPQVVIIAKDIRIAGVDSTTAVSRVDAWLVASGTVNTCYDATQVTTLTINRCATPLTVNGPVMAGKIELWRTAGSSAGAASGDPAEVFNLRPDTYLWGLNRASSSSRVQTTYTKELPPRF